MLLMRPTFSSALQYINDSSRTIAQIIALTQLTERFERWTINCLTFSRAQVQCISILLPETRRKGVIVDMPDIQIESVILDAVQDVASAVGKCTFGVRVHRQDKTERKLANAQAPDQLAESDKHSFVCIPQKLLKLVDDDDQTAIASQSRNGSRLLKKGEQVNADIVKVQITAFQFVLNRYDRLIEGNAEDALIITGQTFSATDQKFVVGFSKELR
ncbi:MAG: hypothetical protein RMJ55_04405 [Roseiflexaceae bacterium]|nr:hypothetical protein [Roseiflexaceae bacterium]